MGVNSLLGRLLLVVGIALLPALFFLAYSETQAQHVRQQLAEQEALRLVYLVSSEQQRIIEGAEQVLDAIGVAMSVPDERPGFCQDLLVNLLAKEPRYRNAGVIGTDGRLQCSGKAEGIGIDLSDRPYFQDAMRTDALVVGDLMIGRVVATPTFVVAKRYRQRSGAVGGVAEVSFSLEWLGKQLERVPLPAGVTARIADRHGMILARRPEGERYVGRSLPADNSFVLQGAAPGVRTTRVIDGTTRIVAYAPPGYDRTGLAVGVGLDPGMIASAGFDRTVLLLVAAGAIMALVLTGSVGHRLINRPVLRLLATTAEWRTGALAARTEVGNDRSEFGRLGKALNEMAAALEKREGAVQTALESTTDAVIVLDTNWHFTYLNRRARSLTDSAEPVGQAFATVFPDVTPADFTARCQAATGDGQPMILDLIIQPAGRQFQTHVYPSADGFTLYLRDITEERRTADALAESEARLNISAEAASLGVWEHNLLTDDLKWSDREWRLHGLEPRPGGPTPEEWLATVHPKDRDRMAAATGHISASTATIEVEYRVVWPNGPTKYLLSRGAAVRDGDGRTIRLAGITIDVTDRRETELALRDSETRLQIARDVVGFGVWQRNLATGVEVWSDEMWRLHGLDARMTPPGLLTRLAMTHPDDRERLNADRLRWLEDPKKEFHSVYRVVWPDDTVRWLQARVAFVQDPGGEATYVVGLAFDVTENREAVDALRQLSEGLEQRVRQEIAAREVAQERAAQAERVQALGQLAGGIAHDFNNILQAVSGAMTLIERRASDANAVRRLSKIATEATERGASITRRLLTFGRRGDREMQPFDIAALLRGLQDVLIHTLGGTIEINLELASGLSPVTADRRQLETVLVNLATNARDAMPTGGRLTISAEPETVLASDPPHTAGIEAGSYVRLTAADTGTGMDPDTLARAGEAFFTTKKPGAGTGLGLAMARGFAEQSGGGMRLESSLGAGTRITLWLPLASIDADRPSMSGGATSA